ncbi:hypothetical protein [Bacillus safensis]|uniref:hypothetical protein n=1 Tax=Bacillus safensis TaxID=561879 RepID=UPI00227FBAA3|nr:hypothetical protein [Bacillus safensis]MCY7479793.1 hypothetical protein [Bacillus safensis]MCY7513644.1 hypothetical protein [Bacillus safensis]MED0719135.1 hypothetical protein [Bacillus safensis]MED4747520.1 hypothetical protein [Bacillus safensis]
MTTKAVNLTTLGELTKKYDEKKKVQLNEEFHLYIYPEFAPSKIAEVLKELNTDYFNGGKNGLKIDEIAMTDWLYFLIIKKFTSLKIPNSLKSKMSAYINLVDSGLMGQIMMSFPEESIQKVLDHIKSVEDAVEQLVDSDLDNKTEQVIKALDEL